MIKSFKTFWKEYFEVVAHSCRWLKKHWIGYIILCVVTWALVMWGIAGHPLPKLGKKDEVKDELFDDEV